MARVNHWVIPVKGLTCASCVNRLQQSLNGQDQVEMANVNLVLETLDVQLSDTISVSILSQWVRDAGFSLMESSETLTLKNLSCASCVGKIEKKLLELPGIVFAEVNLATTKLNVQWVEGATSLTAIKQLLSSLNYPAENQRGDEATGALKTHVLIKFQLCLGVVLSLPMIIAMIASMFGLGWNLPAWLQWLLATPVQFWLGWRFYHGAYASLKHGSANMDVLVALGTSVAYGYSLFLWQVQNVQHLYFEASSVVITLVLLGKFMESRAKHMTGDAIRQLMSLQPPEAQRWQGGKLVAVIISELKVGDEIQVVPGETIPVDGMILSGQADLDESMLTGESNTLNKTINDLVWAGTSNINGSLRLKIQVSPEQFRLKQIVQLVESAQMKKPAVQYLVDKIAAVFVPVVITIALVTLGIQWRLNGFEFALMAAVSVLVIACPCALGLATPTAIIAGIGVGAKRGILIRDISQLESLAGSNVIVFDKTGTLTEGKPNVIAEKYWILDEEKKTLIESILAIQMRSQHPVAKAMVSHLEMNTDLAPVEPEVFINHSGKGVEAIINGDRIFLGNERLLNQFGIELEDEYKMEEGHTVVWVARNNKVVANFAVEDSIKPDAKATIDELKKYGFEPWILSGDHQLAVDKAASELGVEHALGNLLPDHKLQAIEQLKRENKVLMVGDGINDAPALAAADASIAMGQGTDVAMESSGITLVRPELTLIVEGIQLSKKILSKIRHNLFWAFIYNMIGIPLAAMGLLSPVVAGIAMAFSSVSVVASSLLLNYWKPNREN